MGQCFGRCCHSNRVRPNHSDSLITLTSKKAQDWIQSDSDDHQKDENGDKSNTLDNWQTIYNDATTAVENNIIKPLESPCDEFNGELEDNEEASTVRKSMTQDQKDESQSDHTHYHENEVRSMIGAPNDFDNFIRHVIVPKFEKQRLYGRQNQFAVLVLVTDEDLRNISQMKFHPYDPPIINNDNLSMPDNEKEYHNYIVARPDINANHHAEKEIFEHLDQLWNGFMRHSRGIPPKCFILYSWNFPCTKCTQLIIDSFNKPRYKSVSVIVAATAYWEKRKIREQNEAKIEQERFHLSYHRGITLPDHITNDSGSYYYTDSYSDDSSEQEYYNDMYW